MQTVEIDFLDTTTFDFWMPVEDLDKLQCSRCHARGLLIKETDLLVYVALLHRTDEDGKVDIVSNIALIPTGAIVSRRVVEDASSV